MKKLLVDSWYHPHWWNYLLLPLAAIFYIISSMRYLLYRFGILKQHKFTIPIIVVGNITVGGVGKTPLVIYLVEQLRKRGFRPAVISRGYGRSNQHLQWVTPKSSAKAVGDEPLLIAQRVACPIVVCASRVLAVKALLAKTDCNVIISDDGLQHYALGRTIEIAVMDGVRRLGNRMLLPAGPLREPAIRLTKVDFVVNNGDQQKNEIPMSLAINKAYHLLTKEVISLDHLAGKTVHAVAGIGNPNRFFKTLIAADIKIIPHIFPDHHFFDANELNFGDDLLIMMTEKDAVKCTDFLTEKMYCVAVNAELPDDFIDKLVNKLPGPK